MIQTRVLRAGKQVLTTAWSKAAGSTQDIARIAYGGEISLRTLPAGQYALQVTVRDELANTTAVQQTKIRVE